MESTHSTKDLAIKKIRRHSCFNSKIYFSYTKDILFFLQDKSVGMKESINENITGYDEKS